MNVRLRMIFRSRTRDLHRNIVSACVVRRSTTARRSRKLCEAVPWKRTQGTPSIVRDYAEKPATRNKTIIQISRRDSTYDSRRMLCCANGLDRRGASVHACSDPPTFQPAGTLCESGIRDAAHDRRSIF